MFDLTDWNCDLLSSIPAQSSIDLSNVLESLRFLHDMHGFSRFCMMPQYDCTKEPVSVFLLKRASYEDALKMALPSSISVQYGAKVLMRKGLSQTSDLVTLADQTAGLLPLLLPLAEYQDWMDEELNQLLYKKHFKLLIMCAELIPYLYPTEVAERLFRIQNACYQFQYSALTDPKIKRLIYNLLYAKKNVLFGSGVSNLQKAWNFDLPYYRASAKDLFRRSELEIAEQYCRHLWMRAFPGSK